MDIRNHRLSIRDCRLGIRSNCPSIRNRNLGIGNPNVGIDRQLGLKGGLSTQVPDFRVKLNAH
jgi:hypothetical protein